MTTASTSVNAPTRHRVVIIGGGFGGLRAARALRGASVDVTLIDRRNYHLFQPLLYQVATGGLSPANIAAPLRAVLKHQRNARVLMATVTDFDLPAGEVILDDASRIPYDSLVVAAGAANSYFGHDAWEQHAPGLKTISDATEMRRRMLGAFEHAEREPDPAARGALLTFVVIGGGPTGVELAGAIAEIARHTLRREFRSIDSREARVLLLEGADRVLPPYPPELSRRAEVSLQRLGVTVHTSTFVTDVQADHVRIRRDDAEQRIETRTVLWGAGIRAASIGATLAKATGAETDKTGRIVVQRDCAIENHPNVFVIGDLALFRGSDGAPLPGIAPVAMQQGEYVARVIQDRHAGRPSPPFRYNDRGMMATIGRAAAVAVIGRRPLSGYMAWLAWLFIHLLFLIQFQNRVLVLLQWAWNYSTWSRSSRLIVDYRAETRQE